MSLDESSPSKSDPSPSWLAVGRIDDADWAFLEALCEAGLLAELDPDELGRVAGEVVEADDEARRVTMLERYYDANGDALASERRRAADRFFLLRASEPATAPALVDRLNALLPELPGIALARLGGDDGPVVLRSGEHVAAVTDEDEDEGEDTATTSGRMVSLRGLVRAVNVLLDRFDVRERLVALRGDEEREVYVRVGVTSAVVLANAGHLEHEGPGEVMEHGAW